MDCAFRNLDGGVFAAEPFFPLPGKNGQRSGRFVAQELNHCNGPGGVLPAWALYGGE